MVRKLITTLVIGGFAAFAAGSVSAAANDCTIVKPAWKTPSWMPARRAASSKRSG